MLGDYRFVGLALAAWTVFWQIKVTWEVQNLARQVEIDYLWFWLGLGIVILGTLQLAGASVLLRRLARPAPAGSVVRGLARFWVTFTLCMVGFHSWVAWELASTLHYLDVNPYRLIGLWGVVLAVASFWIGSLPPLWSLSGRPR